LRRIGAFQGWLAVFPGLPASGGGKIRCDCDGALCGEVACDVAAMLDAAP